MATISITIPNDKVAKALEGFLEIYPNSERVVSEDLETEGEAKYTNAQWVSEKMRRILIRDIHRGLNMKARKEVNVVVDDTIAE